MLSEEQIKIIKAYDKFYENISNFKHSDFFHKLYIPDVNVYINNIVKKDKCDEDKSKIDEDDYLNSLSNKYKKIKRKQFKQKLYQDEELKNKQQINI